MVTFSFIILDFSVNCLSLSFDVRNIVGS